ncbi:MAG: GH116 family glycosyl-hydrolase [Anaerolineales bacterium]
MTKASFFTHEQLYDWGKRLEYRGRQQREIAFPLGGIGTGCVSLSGRGSLVDWEIFNRPNKGCLLPYAFFTIWAKPEGGEPVTRVLQSPPTPPYNGTGRARFGGFGFGVTRLDGSGFPHMREGVFRGEFPFAWLSLADPRLPVQVSLEAFSPFIPMNADDSGLPIAVLTYRVHNPGERKVAVTIAGNMQNPVGYAGTGDIAVSAGADNGLGGNVNASVASAGLRSLFLSNPTVPADSARYGTLALSTTWPEGFCQTHWLRGAWVDMMHDFWDHLSTDGSLAPREYGPSARGLADVGTLGAQLTLNPGETRDVTFLITWHWPNAAKYWCESGGGGCACENAPTWRNYYATQWADALAVARYYAANAERLHRETLGFHDVLFASDLPRYVLDAVSSQASILHTPTVMRLEDGTFYGWEGCHCDSGCCEGSCTHVWNYAQTVAFLFPELERSLRNADYRYNMRPDGRMGFRLQLPLGSPPWEFHAAADGQMGGIIKVYRDWRLCGDDDWLRSLWPDVKRALEYAWVQWDADRDGVMEGIQHNTYDIEFVGPNTMVGTLYLGALKAGAEMARYLGDADSAAEYERLYCSGRARIERELFNGEYYVQPYDPADAPKYQYGEGCLSDQVIGQWLAHLAGLGDLLDPAQVKSALRAVFEYNWQPDLWEHANPQRIFALNDEQALLLCTWPNGGRVTFPFPYSDEVFCGIEYQVASHLIYEGLVDEGLTIVKGLRNRHDGERRNPWNEMECGSHYARSLASWSLVTALSGFAYGPGWLSFAPRIEHEGAFTCFWSVDGAWGLYHEEAHSARLEVAYGQLHLHKLGLRQGKLGEGATAQVNREPVPCSLTTEGEMQFAALGRPVVLCVGDTLTLS